MSDLLAGSALDDGSAARQPGSADDTTETPSLRALVEESDAGPEGDLPRRAGRDDEPSLLEPAPAGENEAAADRADEVEESATATDADEDQLVGLTEDLVEVEEPGAVEESVADAVVVEEPTDQPVSGHEFESADREGSTERAGLEDDSADEMGSMGEGAPRLSQAIERAAEALSDRPDPEAIQFGPIVDADRPAEPADAEPAPVDRGVSPGCPHTVLEPVDAAPVIDEAVVDEAVVDEAVVDEVVVDEAVVDEAVVDEVVVEATLDEAAVDVADVEPVVGSSQLGQQEVSSVDEPMVTVVRNDPRPPAVSVLRRRKRVEAGYRSGEPVRTLIRRARALHRGAAPALVGGWADIVEAAVTLPVHLRLPSELVALVEPGETEVVLDAEPVAGALDSAPVRRLMRTSTPSRPLVLAPEATALSGAALEALGASIGDDRNGVVIVVALDPESDAPTEQRVDRLTQSYGAAGFRLVDARHGSLRRLELERSGGSQLLDRLSSVSARHLHLLSESPAELRRWLNFAADEQLAAAVAAHRDDELVDLARDLGGHDPAVIGPVLTGVGPGPALVITEMAYGRGLGIGSGWVPATGRLLADQLPALDSPPGPSAQPRIRTGTPPARIQLGIRSGMDRTSSQEAFGRFLAAAADDTALGSRMVTVSAGLAGRANLSAWIGRVGAAGPGHLDSRLGDVVRPDGRHLEMRQSTEAVLRCVSELIRLDPEVIPLAVLDDDNATLAPGAVGAILDGRGWPLDRDLISSVFEPVLDWLLCDAFDRSAIRSHPVYIRLHRELIDRRLIDGALQREGPEQLRRHVLRGAYLVMAAPPSGSGPLVQLVTAGPELPGAVSAATELAGAGVRANVWEVTGAARLRAGWLEAQAAERRGAVSRFHLENLVAEQDRRAPIILVGDHGLDWLGGVFGAPVAVIDSDEAEHIADAASAMVNRPG